MTMKLVKFVGAAMKAMKNPAMLSNLEDFHKGLIIHMQYLEARQADGVANDFEISFLADVRKYLDFLKAMGADLEIPAKQPVSAVTIEDIHRPKL